MCVCVCLCGRLCWSAGLGWSVDGGIIFVGARDLVSVALHACVFVD